MATKKTSTTSTAKKSTTNKPKADKPKTKKPSVNAKDKKIAELMSMMEDLSKQNEDLAAQLTETVPKQKLRSESITERANWVYNDLTGWERVAAHGIMLMVTGAVVFGIYFVVNKIAGDAEFSEYLSILLSVAGAVWGVKIQGSALKLPTEKII